MSDIESGRTFMLNSNCALRRALRERLRSVFSARRAGGMPNNRIKPVHDVEPPTRMFRACDETKRWSNTDKPTNRRQNRQHNQRRPHRRRRFMRPVRTVSVAAMFVSMSVRRHVMSNVFVHWTNVFAGFVTRTIAC